jgi:D-aminopeptidase
MVAACLVSAAAEPPLRPRARDLGLVVGVHPPGGHNAITDVAGVRVGHTTLWRGEGKLVPGQGPVRTGVTAILAGADPWAEPCPAAAFVFNGNGEMTGLACLQDLGVLETPILLTNTLNVGKVADAAVTWILARHPEVGITADVPLPVVAECDDSTLNDIQGRHVGEKEVLAALEAARGGPVEEGAVGGGTGMIAYGFKAGIGTSSRVLSGFGGPSYTVGVLVMANQGDRAELRVDGVPVGREIPEDVAGRHSQGSIIIIVATDAPLSRLQLGRLARRAIVGLARTGATGHHGSGDLVLAFSMAGRVPRDRWDRVEAAQVLPDPLLDTLYEGTAEATEEAILNALLRARTTVGRDGNTAVALPLGRLREVMARYGRPLRDWPAGR